MFIADRNIITLRNQKPNAEVFAHCQHRNLGVICPVVSLPTNFCLSSEIQPVLLGIDTPKPEQEKAILQFLLGRDVFVALPTAGAFLEKSSGGSSSRAEGPHPLYIAHAQIKSVILRIIHIAQ